MTISIPNTQTLQALRATAQLGSFSAAADHLGVTQGAVAQQVRQFEAIIGFQLFDRWARGLRPTPTCLTYIGEIEVALDRIADATASLSQNNPANAHHVTVSTTPSIASRWLIPKLSDFYLHHSEIVIAIDATEKLRHFTGPNATDIALRWGGSPAEGQNAEPILSNLLIAVASPKLLGSQTPSLELLTSAPLINDGHHFWRSWSTSFSTELPSKPLDFGQTNHAIDAAINGLGIALVPYMLVKECINNNQLCRVLPPNFDLEAHVEFFLITKKGEPRDAVRTVCQWIKDQT